MRRVKILFYWLFKDKNNITFSILLQFLFKPSVTSIARPFIKEIKESDDHFFSVVKFHHFPEELFWPNSFPINRIYQVVAETFDTKDWHFYQKKHTEIKKGERLLDIGAAEGLFALAVAEKCEKIVMVEPSSSFVKALQQTFIKHSNKVEIVQAAVGDFCGEVPFEESSLDGSLYLSETSTNFVEIKTVDAIVGNQNITYLKADVEGFEQQVIAGATQTIKRCKPKIAITCYHKQNNADEMIAAIKAIVPEYQFYKIGVYQEGGKPVMIHGFI
ncbi:MAG: FkbM family methyltransferase [Flavobacterium sp.]|jgi:FkbM family methyltransferase|nr:FkbM family methyltransferase [Flavobacterium sp.]